MHCYLCVTLHLRANAAHTMSPPRQIVKRRDPPSHRGQRRSMVHDAAEIVRWMLHGAARIARS
jgi:hypothetical protein